MRIRRIGLAFAGLAVALALLVVFDEAWLRPLAQRYVRVHADRSLEFSRVAFRLDGAGRPLLRVHDLLLSNASWAASAPLIRAGEAEMVVAWESLQEHRLVLQRIRLREASVDLERRADGTRNWRIADPNDRGPGRVRVIELDADRSQLRFVHEGLALETTLHWGPPAAVPAATAPSSPAVRYTRSITGSGIRDGVRFDVAVDTGDSITFYDSRRDFLLRGTLKTAHAAFSLDGSARDLAQLAGIDARMQASARNGDGIRELSTIARGAALPFGGWPVLAGELTVGRLKKEGRQWRLTDALLRLGRSDAAGEFDLHEADPSDAAAEPLHLRLKFTSRRIDLAELRADLRPARPPGVPVPVSQAGAPPPLPPASAAVAQKSDRPAIPASASGSLPRSSSASSSTAASAPAAAASANAPRRLPRFDADIEGRVQTLVGVPRGAVDDLVFDAHLHDATWAVPALRFAYAGGKVSGHGSFVAGQSPGRLSAGLRLEGVQLARLGLRDLRGGLDAQAAVDAHGDSVQALVSTAQGHAQGALVGASLPTGLDAKLGLDLGHWVGSWFGGPKRTAITCSAFDFDLAAGRASVRSLALETDDLLVTGAGSIDLTRRTLALTLTPHHRRKSLLTLDRSIRIDGTFAKPSIGLIGRVEGNPAQCRRPVS